MTQTIKYAISGEWYTVECANEVDPADVQALADQFRGYPTVSPGSVTLTDTSAEG